jgi:hypothetical protein
MPDSPIPFEGKIMANNISAADDILPSISKFRLYGHGNPVLEIDLMGNDEADNLPIASCAR